MKISKRVWLASLIIAGISFVLTPSFLTATWMLVCGAAFIFVDSKAPKSVNNGPEVKEDPFR